MNSKLNLTDQLYSCFFWNVLNPPLAYELAKIAQQAVNKADLKANYTKKKSQFSNGQICRIYVYLIVQEIIRKLAKDSATAKFTKRLNKEKNSEDKQLTKHFEKIRLATSMPNDYEELVINRFRIIMASLSELQIKILQLKLQCQLELQTVAIYLNITYEQLVVAYVELKTKFYQATVLKDPTRVPNGVVFKVFKLDFGAKMSIMPAVISNEYEFKKMLVIDPSSERADYLKYAMNNPELTTEIIEAIRFESAIKNSLNIEKIIDDSFNFEKANLNSKNLLTNELLSNALVELEKVINYQNAVVSYSQTNTKRNIYFKFLMIIAIISVIIYLYTSIF